jgi:replication factor A1
VLQLIEEKKNAYDGFLSDEGAIHLVAQELSVTLENKQFNETLPLNDLILGFNDVTVIGRIITVWPIKNFKRSNGDAGSLLRLLISDGTAKTMCINWNPKKELCITAREKFLGRIVKIMHGYTRKGLTGDIEIHMGERGIINLIPPDEEPAIPPLASFINYINNIENGDTRVNLNCRSDEVPHIISFNKGNNKEGKVARLMISDTSGSAKLVAWNQKADEISTVKLGDSLMIWNAKTKKGQEDIIEIHASSMTLIEINSKRSIIRK